MPTLTYDSVKYPSKLGRDSKKGINGYYISEADLVRAAVSVGRESWKDVIKYGTYSYYEMLYRVLVIIANISSSSDVLPLKKTAAYKNLDPSEKSAISYFLGMTLTKLVTEDVLDIPWLLHLDVYKEFYPTEYWNENEKQRPDFICRNNKREWLVAESKGRTGKFSQKAFDKAKEQTKCIRTIGGDSPVGQIATEAFFVKDVLNFKLDDPVEFDSDAVELEITPRMFLSDYYQPFINLLSYQRSTEVEIYQNSFQVVTIREVDVSIGLLRDLFGFIKKGDFEGVVDYSLATRREFEGRNDVSLGRDGVVVILGKSWDRKLENG